MIVLSTRRYGEEAYGSVSCGVLTQLDAVHHKDVRLALSTFIICRTERQASQSWTKSGSWAAGHPNHWKIPARRPEEMVDRRRLHKKRPKMEKRKQRDEREEPGRRQKGGYKRNTNETASVNIQTQNRVYKGHPRPQEGPSTTWELENEQRTMDQREKIYGKDDWLRKRYWKFTTEYRNGKKQKKKQPLQGGRESPKIAVETKERRRCL
jgi:hypothetical protein